MCGIGAGNVSGGGRGSDGNSAPVQRLFAAALGRNRDELVTKSPDFGPTRRAARQVGYNAVKPNIIKLTNDGFCLHHPSYRAVNDVGKNRDPIQIQFS